MQEIFEFRLYERLVKQFLPDNVGKKAGPLARVIRVSRDTHLFSRIAEEAAKAKEEGRDDPIASWSVRRRYSERELLSAEVIHLCVDHFIDIDSEGAGTQYDYSSACKICGVGRQLIGSLKLPRASLANLRGITTTISKDEVLIPATLVDALNSAKITGAKYNDICFNDDANGDLLNPSPVKQLIVSSNRISAVAPSQFGIDPFDYDVGRDFCCPLGHLAGLNLLSELYVSLDAWDGSDWFQTEQCVGIRRGSLAPAPLFLISQKLYRLLRDYPLQGCRFEIAHTK